MSEVKRYFTQLWKIESSEQRYAHGALGAVEIVRASDFDRVTAERDAALGREAALIDQLDAALRQVKANWDYAQDKQQRLTEADERADMLESEVARLNRAKLSLKELAESRADNCSVYRQHLTVALALAEKVRGASLGMQRKFLTDLIDHLHQSGAALKPAEGGGDEK